MAIHYWEIARCRSTLNSNPLPILVNRSTPTNVIQPHTWSDHPSSFKGCRIQLRLEIYKCTVNEYSNEVSLIISQWVCCPSIWKQVPKSISQTNLGRSAPFYHWIPSFYFIFLITSTLTVEQPILSSNSTIKSNKPYFVKTN